MAAVAGETDGEAVEEAGRHDIGVAWGLLSRVRPTEKLLEQPSDFKLKMLSKQKWMKKEKQLKKL